MRRTLLTLTLLITSVVVWAQPFDPFMPANPVVMGRGGSYTATATGYNSFFYNPAGFARSGEFTLASANVWAFMDRDMISIAQDIALGTFGLPRGDVSGAVTSGARALDADALASLEAAAADLAEWVAAEDPAVVEQILQNAAGDTGLTFESGDDIADFIAAADPEDLTAFLEAVDTQATLLADPLLYPAGAIGDLLSAIDTALPSGYLRVGGQVGIGYLGNGIGVGLFANTEATLDGTNLLSANGTAYNTITFLGGLGLTFGRLNVGVAVRPMIFGYSTVNAAPLFISYLSGSSLDYGTIFTNSVYYGSGLGIDLGALWTVGPLSFGLAARDFLGTRIDYRKSSFTDYYEALLSASLPIGSELTQDELDDAWTIPMKVGFGAEFHPDLGVVSFLFDPSISFDVLDVTSVIRSVRSGEEVTPEQALGMLNIGAQANLLRFLSVRGGYYGGFLSAGVGLDIFLLDINAAVAGDFGKDSSGAWSFTNVGGSVEVSLRF